MRRKSNVLHRFLSYLKVYLAKVFSIHCVKTSGLKLNSEEEISIECFRRRPQRISLRQLQCDVEYFDCYRSKSQSMYISNLVC